MTMTSESTFHDLGIINDPSKDASQLAALMLPGERFYTIHLNTMDRLRVELWQVGDDHGVRRLRTLQAASRAEMMDFIDRLPPLWGER